MNRMFFVFCVIPIIVIGFGSCRKLTESKNELPTCKITSPLNNTEIKQGTTVRIVVEAEDKDGHIKEVRYYIDGIGVYSKSTFPYNYEWDTNYESVGNHTIRVVAIDDENEEAEDEIIVIISIPKPTLTTESVTEITYTAASSGGNVISDGGASVTARGVCWSTSSNPTIYDNHTTDGSGTGSFTSSITGLSPGTKYYVRAYATNRKVTAYGQNISFTTSGESGTVTDIDGNVYKTVKIGEQWWMAENLKVTKYRNGDAIPKVTVTSTWDYQTSGAYCNYSNDDASAYTYGSLYNWYAVNDSRNIAPEGWHVPTDEEWKQLEMYVGISQSETDDTDWRGTDEGDKLKSTSGWNYNGNGTDDYGFSALPGGYRGSDGYYNNLGSCACFWSSTENGGDNAWFRKLCYDYTEIYRNLGSDQFGFSVRCVKD